MSDTLLSISQAAKKLGVAAVTLRLWERQGKIKSLRTGGNQRRYSNALLESFLQNKNKLQIQNPPSTTPLSPSYVGGGVRQDGGGIGGDRSGGILDTLKTPVMSPFQKQVLAWTLAVVTLAGGGAGIYKYSGGNGEGVNKILGWFKNHGIPEQLALSNEQSEGSVLAAETVNDDYRFVVNVPSLFNKNITAPNIIYGLTAGANITITGGQNPTISATVPDQTTDLKIFKTVKVGSKEISAGSKTDTLELVAGSNVTLSTSDKKITIAASSTDITTSGWTDDGAIVRLTTAGNLVSLGVATGAARLNLNVDDDTDLLTASKSGNLKFKLNSNGVITNGAWNGTAIDPAYGGTGVVNNTASTLTISGNYATTLTLTGTTGVTLPTTGTLATLAGTETLTNKTLTIPVISQIVNTGTLTLPTSTDTLVGRATTDTLTNKTWNGVKISEIYGGTNQSSYTTGDILYSSATNTLSKLAVGSAGQVLTVTGGVPVWAGGLGGTGTVGYWQRSSGGVLAPDSITDDLAIGGTSTASALFKVSGTTGNVITSGTLTLPNSNTLTGQTGNIQLSGGVSVGGGTTYYVNTSGNANFNTLNAATTTLGGTTVTSLLNSGSASVSGGLILYGVTTVSTTNKQTLTLGDSSTGNIAFGQTITSGTWNGTAIGPTYGGTNQTSWTTGDILYASGTNTLAKLGIGSATQVLTVSGGVPAWTDNTSIGNWQRNSGTVSPLNITDDILVGGISTAAATLRISAAGVITLPNSNTLTGVSGYTQLSGGISVGGGTTYYINNLGTANLNGLTAATTSLGGTTVTSLTDTGSASVSGALTLYTTPTIATASKQTLTLGDSNSGNVVVTNNLSAANLSGTNTGDQTITLTGDVTGTGTGSFATTIGAGKVTNTMLAGGITEVKGGTGQSTYTTGDILYSSATNTLAKLGIGSANQVLSVVSGIPGWVDSGSVGTNYWNVSSGALFPLSSTADLLVGGQSTASAKFAFINVNSGTPTASVSGNLTLNSVGVIATTNKQTLTIGDANTGDIAFSQAIRTTQGGTGLTSYTTGDLPYASGTNILGKLGIGSTNQVLIVSGGVPTWGSVPGSSCTDCILNDPGSTQTITPTVSTGTGLRVAQASGGTVDVFSVTNNGSTTKYFAIDSSGNATSSGNLTFDSAVNLQTTKNQTLTIGGNTTGNISLANTVNATTFGSTITLPNTNTLTGITNYLRLSQGLSVGGADTYYINSSGTGNLNALTLAGTITLPNTNTLTGVSGYAQASAGISVGGATTYYINNLGTANLNGLTAATTSLGGTTVTSLTDTGSASVSGALTLYTTPTIATTAKQTLTLGDSNTGNIAFGQTITSGTWNGTAIGPTYGGTNQTTWTTGDILYASGTNTLAKLGIGSTSQVLTVSGGVPTWGAGASSSNWQRNSGAIAPLNITDDLLIGATSTASAKFSVISGSGNLTTAGTITLPNTNTLTGVSGYVQASAGLSVGGGTTYYINNLGTANLNAATVNSTLAVTGATTLTGALTANSTASVSGAMTLFGTPTIATTAKQSLTLGDSNTGNIIMSGGNVGIGTTGPASTLEVSALAAGEIARFTAPSASAGWISTSQVATPRALYGHANSTGGGIISGGIASAATIRGDAGIQFATAFEAPKMVILPTSGNVGIGTTSPLAKLDVNGTASVSGALSLYATATINSTAMKTLTLGGSTTGNIVIDSGTGVVNVADLTASRAVFTDASSNLTSTGASADLLASLSDETGTGVAVFGTSPAITTSLTTGSTTFALVNTTATTVNFAGAATTLSVGAATGTTTVNNALTIAGTTTANGAFTLGDNGDTGSIDTSDWNINSTGDLSGIGSIAADGNITQSGSTTFTTGTGTVTVAGAATVSASLALGPQSAAPATCNAANEGRIFYFGTSAEKKLYFCNGTSWTALATGLAGVSYQTISPEFPGAVISADGSNNTGTFTSDREATGSGSLYSFNYYEFTSGQTSLQDYDVYVRWEVPENFSSWATSNAITIDYATEDTSSANNKIDIQITKENDADTVTSSSNVSPTAGKWQSSILSSSPISFTSANLTSAITWAAGDIAVIRIRLFSKDNYFARVGAIKFDWQ